MSDYVFKRYEELQWIERVIYIHKTFERLRVFLMYKLVLHPYIDLNGNSDFLSIYCLLNVPVIFNFSQKASPL